MSSFKEFYKSYALLRTFSLLCKLKKSNPKKLGEVLKITPTAVVSQLKELETKKYIKSFSDGRMQIYEPNTKFVVSDYLKIQKPLLIQFAKISKHSEEINPEVEKYFQTEYIKKVFSKIENNDKLIELINNWFGFFGEFYTLVYTKFRKEINFYQIFIDILPKEIVLHYKNFKIDNNLIDYFRLLDFFQINMTIAGKQAFLETESHKDNK